LVSYRVSGDLVKELRRRGFDTVVVSGEGNRRAELLALLAGPARRVEVRDDGAAHVFWFAPYKPLALLATFLASVMEKVTLTALVGLVWGGIVLEGCVWRSRRRLEAGRAVARGKT
jgi:hypothetical protein